MSRALKSLHIHLKVNKYFIEKNNKISSFKNRVLDLSYSYGFFVADHSLYVILVCFGVFLLCL